MTKETRYLAYVLTQSCRDQLLKLFKPKFATLVAHHVTIIRPESPLMQDLVEDISFLQSYPHLYSMEGGKYGRQCLTVVGLVWVDGVECLVVQAKRGMVADLAHRAGVFLHLTLSLEPPHRAVESNELRDKPFTTVPEFTLDGSLQILTRNKGA